MIEPTERDIGRAVVYQRDDKLEDGFITSFNDDCVFVRCRKFTRRWIAANREYLRWDNQPVKT